MKYTFTKEWSARMADLEGDHEIGAGIGALDPFEPRSLSSNVVQIDSIRAAFGCFINLERRKLGLDVAQFSEEVGLEVSEISGIECGELQVPSPRTVHLLSEYLDIPIGVLMQLSGLAELKNEPLREKTIRFAAKSASISSVTKEEMDKIGRAHV